MTGLLLQCFCQYFFYEARWSICWAPPQSPILPTPRNITSCMYCTVLHCIVNMNQTVYERTRVVKKAMLFAGDETDPRQLTQLQHQCWASASRLTPPALAYQHPASQSGTQAFRYWSIPVLERSDTGMGPLYSHTGLVLASPSLLIPVSGWPDAG